MRDGSRGGQLESYIAQRAVFVTTTDDANTATAELPLGFALLVLFPFSLPKEWTGKRERQYIAGFIVSHMNDQQTLLQHFVLVSVFDDNEMYTSQWTCTGVKHGELFCLNKVLNYSAMFLSLFFQDTLYSNLSLITQMFHMHMNIVLPLYQSPVVTFRKPHPPPLDANKTKTVRLFRVSEISMMILL